MQLGIVESGSLAKVVVGNEGSVERTPRVIWWAIKKNLDPGRTVLKRI